MCVISSHSKAFLFNCSVTFAGKGGEILIVVVVAVYFMGISLQSSTFIFRVGYEHCSFTETPENASFVPSFVRF